MSDDTRSFGLAGVGRSGNISIDLDEPTNDDGPWRLQISGKGWEFVFDVAGPTVAHEATVFVREHSNREIFAEHRLGTFQTADVILVKDSELPDRFWLRIRGTGQMVEATIWDEDAPALLEALEQVVSDLKS